MATYKSIRYNVDYGGKAGALIPLSTFTSDGSDDDASFDSSLITSDYDEYLFIINNIHAEEDGDGKFTFNLSVDNGSNYNVTKTTTNYQAEHDEGNTSAQFLYKLGDDLAQGTGFQALNAAGIGNDNDQCISGFLILYNPSSTTFVKHFLSSTNAYQDNNTSNNSYMAGYGNTTTAVNNVQFKLSSGEIQGGTIQMFGVH